MHALYRTRYGNRAARLDSPLSSIAQLPAHARCVVVKASADVVVGDDGYPCLRRISHMVEQVCSLRREGRNVVLVTSGAIGVGRCALRRQRALHLSPQAQLELRATAKLHGTEGDVPLGSESSLGQMQLSSLYRKLFAELDTEVSSLLLSLSDFTSDDEASRGRRANMEGSITCLLAHGVVPICNENDLLLACDPANDNDELALEIGALIGADAVVVMVTARSAEAACETEAAAAHARMIATLQSMVTKSRPSASPTAPPEHSHAARIVVNADSVDALNDVISRGIDKALFAVFPPPSSSLKADPLVARDSDMDGEASGGVG